MPNRLLALLSLLTYAAACAPDRENTGPNAEADTLVSGQVILSPSAMATAGVAIETIAPAHRAAAETLELPGDVAFDSSRIVVLSPRVPGRLEEMLFARGEHVEREQTVARVSSPEFLVAQSDLIQAARRLAGVEEGLETQSGVRALFDAARQRLQLMGATETDVTRIIEEGESSLFLHVRAPFSGTILEVSAQAGTAVDAGTPLYRLGDLSVVHVVTHVPEGALTVLRVGLRARIAVPAFPDRFFSGEVLRILDEVDAGTRTVPVLVTVANADQALKAGMFATVNIEGVRTTDSATNQRYVLPSAAVLTDGDEHFVFVETQPRTFERTIVRVSQPAPGSLVASQGIVVSGLSEGDRVVVRGAIVLRSILIRASLVDPD